MDSTRCQSIRHSVTCRELSCGRPGWVDVHDVLLWTKCNILTATKLYMASVVEYGQITLRGSRQGWLKAEFTNSLWYEWQATNQTFSRFSLTFHLRPHIQVNSPLYREVTYLLLVNNKVPFVWKHFKTLLNNWYRKHHVPAHDIASPYYTPYYLVHVCIF